MCFYSAIPSRSESAMSADSDAGRGLLFNITDPDFFLAIGETFTNEKYRLLMLLEVRNGCIR